MNRVQTDGASTIDPARIEEALRRIVSSGVLHGSETLCRMMRFLVEQKLDHPDIQLKEYEIATRLLGRSSDFDPRVDPVVRVQIGRLRSKLVEYYAGEGANEDLVIDIPKGSYTPHFLHRSRQLQPHPNGMPAASAPTPSPRPSMMRPLPLWLAATGMLAGSLVAGGWYLGSRNVDADRSRSTPVSASMHKLWSPFVTGAEPPLVVFSNALFVGRPETGLRYYDPKRDKAEDVLDHYTGIGEVFAVSELHRMLARMGSEPRLKRSQLLNWDDARNRPLIFVGSPSEDLRLRDLPLHQKYVFEERYHDAIREIVIRNTAPAQGEAAEYRPDRDNPERADYALITRTTGLDGTSPVLMLAGITTLGTEAAVEFATADAQVAELERLLQGFPSSFTALLSVEVKGGVPVRARLIAAAPSR